MLVNGKWKSKRDPVQSQDSDGRFIRQESKFRNWITPGGSPGPSGEGGFAAEPNRYHLYDALKVFAMLDELEERLGDGRPFLFGDRSGRSGCPLPGQG